MRIVRRPSTLVAVVLAGALLAGMAGCDDSGNGTSPTAAPGASPQKPATVPTLAQLGYTFTLVRDDVEHADVPQTYKVTYLAGKLTLRAEPLVLVGFRVDPAHPGEQSQLLADNRADAQKNGSAATPGGPDGSTGLTYTFPNGQGVSTVRSVMAKGSVTITVSVTTEKTGDTTAATDLQRRIRDSIKFNDTGLSGTYPGTVATPQLPFTLDVPGELAADSYESAIISYRAELGYGSHKTLINTTWQEASAAATAFTSTKAGLDKAGVHHQPDVKTLPALRSSLGPLVDEGFVFNLINDDGLPSFLGVVFRKEGVTVRITTNVGVLKKTQYDADTIAALAAPMAIGQSWTWTST